MNRRKYLRAATAIGCIYLSATLQAQQPSPAPAAAPEIAPVRPQKFVFERPYLAPDVPPVRLGNSGRFANLMRAGVLYLTAQDAIALALENNIDLEVDRYNPVIAEWNLERSQAGGALPGVPSAAGQAGSVASGQGVAGSQAAAGVSAGGGGGGGGGGNASISQIGPITQTLDPSIQETSVFSHTTTPEANATQSITSSLVDTTHVHNISIQEGFVSGGSVTLSYSDHYLRENAATDQLNPTSAPNLSVSLQYDLLRGFGQNVGARTINVNKINLQNSDLNFKNQVIGTVTTVLNQYYALAADYEDRRAKQSALDTAQQFYENTRRQEQLGALSALDVTTAESQVASTQNDLAASQATLLQDELTLKNTLSRSGANDPALSSARIVTLDRITVPDADNLPPVNSLVEQALSNRPDLALLKANITSAEISALGTKNGVLPLAVAIAGASNAGLDGVAPGSTKGNPLVGGIGTGLAQVFDRDFPTERIGAFVQVPINNRQAQADYGVEQLQLRQTQLTTQKSLNQVIVDISNNVIAVQQARARYAAAVKNRELQQQLLDAEQRKFLLGASTPYNVTQQQRDLASASATVLSALSGYSTARVALDQALGTTLESNRVSIGEAKAGAVARPSTLPDTLPASPSQVP
jgi:outer membrane protein